jgi:hypothetical protein
MEARHQGALISSQTRSSCCSNGKVDSFSLVSAQTAQTRGDEVLTLDPSLHQTLRQPDLRRQKEHEATPGERSRTIVCILRVVMMSVDKHVPEWLC